MSNGDILKRPQRTSAVIFLVVTLVYFYSAVRYARHAPLWMDEVLTYYTIRQADLSHVLRAVWSGTDFSPFFMHAVLHVIPPVDQGDLLSPRILSIFSAYGAALCLLRLARKYFELPVAVLSFSLLLASYFFFFAVQAREYALIVFLFSASLLVWSNVCDGNNDRKNLFLLWVFLSLTLCTHFYGVVSIVVMALCETVWDLRTRRIRWPVWITLAATCPVGMAWIPWARHLQMLNAGDQNGPFYYAYPTFEKLWSYTVLFVGGNYVFPIIAVSCLAASFLFPGSGDVPPENAQAGRRVLGCIVLSVGCVPLIVFCLARFLTGSFSARYMADFLTFDAVAIPFAIGWTRRATLFSMLMCPALACMIVLYSADDTMDLSSVRSLRAIPSGLPVVIGEGLLFIELQQKIYRPFSRHAVYLYGLENVPNVDRTNEHAIRYLHKVVPWMRVSQFDDFLRDNHHFYVLSRNPATEDYVSPALRQRGVLCRTAFRDADVTVFEAGTDCKRMVPAVSGH
ncbi:conserved hypothetical protein [Gluconacetobacter diazotrophicus PA1 5]|uniref:Glycosyltransferase RgtA/B/C/D-like domain-containing protein n=2 Tax=Gluconacetobacter diazotrophicus TaxID=33996 RepID=A0A7W4I5X7_GLUDI|nr:hypothetical protein [Gluconacetobacter diazotrophicus]ACI52311.1 conserved hypothetical protein [Gluconacetobacter diazotrophicus PA1 5]MBB2156862.1 hypothetical protein [Gluconacetobacter diazotrophicus]TWB04794.1 hypothetical protein FBZ86_11916 [Gluconacetobacter diazotrophicus]